MNFSINLDGGGKSSLRMLLCLATMILVGQAISAPINIAVNDLTGRGTDSTTAAVLTERVRAELMATNGFRVMERSQMESILREQGFQQSGCTSNSCEVEIGKLLGVDHIVMGAISSLGKAYTLSLRLVNVSSGEVLQTVSEDCQCPIEDVLTTSTKNVAHKLDEAIQKAAFGTLSLHTVPEGANVFLDGKAAGTTNYFNDRFVPRTVKIRLELPTYTPIERELTVEQKKTQALSFTLDRTKVYVDSVNKAEHRVKTKKLIVRQVILGSLSLACAGAGYYFDTRVEKGAKEKHNAYAAYRTAGEGSDFAGLWTAYQSAGPNLKTDESTRNVLYGCSGAMALAFTISFAF